MFSFKRSPLLIRKINTNKAEIYLTFDDGPDAQCTPAVLDLLREEGALATFFVIGDRARKYPALVERMIHEGHSVFSHSIDHRYRHYFRSRAGLKTWLTESLRDLEAQTKSQQKVFRPPAGVLTPPLMSLSQELGIPLILWTHRFYDSTRPWIESAAHKSALKIRPGDIVLLHDSQKSQNCSIFLKTLRFYLQDVKKRGFLFSNLTLSLVETEVLHAQNAAHADSP
jgi:peptidoglycan/xylan/chitin deacetylase (PgdA/CDA1 family)